MENINFDPKNKAKIENVGTQEGGNFIDDVIFEEQQKKSGEKEYKSSSPSRKIIIRKTPRLIRLWILKRIHQKHLQA